MTRNLIVVLLPGLDGTSELLRRFVECTPDGYTTHVVSYAGAREMSYTELVDEVRSQLPTDAPYLLLGESFSGPIAIKLAAESVGDLRGLVLVATFATRPAAAIWRYLPWRTIFRMAAPTSILRQFLSGADDELTKEMREAIRSVDPQVLASRVRSTLAVDVRADLAKVACPILYLQAKRDLIVPARCLRTIQAVRPDVLAKCFDTRHLVLQTAPLAAWKAVTEFGANLPDGDAS